MKLINFDFYLCLPNVNITRNVNLFHLFFPELSQDNVPINRFQYDPNVWNAYQDNRFEVNEPLVNYLSQLPDLNDYVSNTL